MKRFSCLSLRSVGLFIGSADVICAIATLTLCSVYLYEDFVEVSQLQEGVQVQNPLTNYVRSVVDYILVHNFSSAFYMVLCLTLCIKSFINLVVASILIDGIRKQRPLCLAPWLLNTTISVFIEIAIFVFMEVKIDEEDLATQDRQIARAIVFGVFLVLNALFAFGIFALYKTMKTSTVENQTLQESIVEAADMFQHVKV